MTSLEFNVKLIPLFANTNNKRSVIIEYGIDLRSSMIIRISAYSISLQTTQAIQDKTDSSEIY